MMSESGSIREGPATPFHLADVWFNSTVSSSMYYECATMRKSHYTPCFIAYMRLNARVRSAMREHVILRDLLATLLTCNSPPPLCRALKFSHWWRVCSVLRAIRHRFGLWHCVRHVTSLYLTPVLHRYHGSPPAPYGTKAVD